MHIKFAPIPPCDCLGMASLWAIPPPRSGINPHSPAGWANSWANSQQASYFEFLPLQPYLIMQAEIPFGGIGAKVMAESLSCLAVGIKLTAFLIRTSPQGEKKCSPSL